MLPETAPQPARGRTRGGPAALALALLLGPGCGDQDPPADLVLLYTGNVHGYIEPCGCVAGQIGGIDRIAGYVQEQLAAAPDRTIFVETGDLLFEGVPEDPRVIEQLALKAAGFFEVWGRLGCDAMALGEAEVAVGIDVVRELAEREGVPLVCANIVDAEGQQVFPESVVLERGGLRIGIFSVLAERLDEARVRHEGDPPLRTFNLSTMLQAQGYRLEPWLPHAQRIASELAQDCDLVLLASHLGFDRNAQVARAVPELDLVFGGHFGKSEAPTTDVDGTPVLTTSVRGGRVGHMEWWWEDFADYAERGEPLVDVTRYREVFVEAEVERLAYMDLTGREAAFGTELWEFKRETHRVNHALSVREHEQLGSPPRVNRFSNILVPMHRNVPRSDVALAAVDEYHRATDAHWEVDDDRTMGDGSFVGAAACVDCHPAQVEFWLATRHSRAFATLEATAQERDAECIGCHTIGYGERGGFDHPGRSRGFENVQCAACHGGGGAHLTGGISYILPNVLSQGFAGCARCHRDEHDPAFAEDGASRVPLVACPPLEPAGLASAALQAARIEAAQAMEARPNPDWASVLRIYVATGATQQALRVARRWYRDEPASIDARLSLAEQLLDAGRSDEAVPHYRAVVKFAPETSRAWAGLAFALMEESPDRALVAAREAHSLDPSQPLALRLIVVALLELGRVDEARTTLETFAGQWPAAAPQLADLFERVAGDS